MREVQQLAFDRLREVLPEAQQEQLAELLLHRLSQGWGVLEIEIQDHHIKAFREVNSIPAKRENI